MTSMSRKLAETPLGRAQYEAQIRRSGQWVLFWSAAVRFPLIAFSLGGVLQQSAWLLIPGILVLIITTVGSGLGIVSGLASIAVYFLIPNTWCGCFLAALSFSAYVQSRANYLHTEQQVAYLLNDLLSPTSNYTIEEIAVPEIVYQGFPSYIIKEAERARVEQVVRTSGMSAAEMVPFKSKPLRAFRFASKGERNSVGAAVAYPFHRYSSLIFVRHDFTSLNDAHRFQIYHELAHGTPEGTDVLLKPLRWRVAGPLASLFMFSMFIMSCAVVYRTPNSVSWASLLCLGLANLLRNATEREAQRRALAASEVLADSVALSHPDFSTDGKWKTRAANQAKRLEDELADMALDAPRRLQVFVRAAWLRRWLSLSEIPPYHVGDVDPRALAAFLLYVAAGATSGLSSTFETILFWSAFTVCVVLSNLLLPRNGWLGNSALISVERALAARLVATGSGPPESPEEAPEA